MTHHYCKSCFSIFKNISIFLLSVKTILLCSFLYIWDIYTDFNFALTLLQNGSSGKSDLSLSTSHRKESKWRIHMKNKKKRKRKELWQGMEMEGYQMSYNVICKQALRISCELLRQINIGKGMSLAVFDTTHQTLAYQENIK